MSKFVDQLKRDFRQFSRTGMNEAKFKVFPSGLSSLNLNLIGHSLPKIFLTKSGYGKLSVDSEAYKIDKRHILVAGQRHQIKLEKIASRAVIYELTLNTDTISIHLYAGTTSSKESYSIPFYGSHLEQDLIHVWSLLIFKSLSENNAEAYHRSLVTMVLAYCLELMEDKKWLAGKIRYVNKKLKFEQLFYYIAHHMTEDLSKEELCTNFNISAKLFTYIFQHWQRTTFKQVIAQMRIDQIRMDLLEDNHPKISELAQKWGFNSTAHFIYTFKKMHNISPYKLNLRLKSKTPKSLEQLQQLHYVNEFTFIPEREPSTLPERSIVEEDNPTVCYFINENPDYRHVYELGDDGSEHFLVKFKQHRRYRFNISVGVRIIIKNDDMENVGWFEVEDKLCQALVTR